MSGGIPGRTFGAATTVAGGSLWSATIADDQDTGGERGGGGDRDDASEG